MDFTYPQGAEAFRKEFRAWLDENLTDDLLELAQHPVGDDPDRIERMRAWNRTLADARYAAMPGLPSTAAGVRRSWSRSSTPRRCTAPARPER